MSQSPHTRITFRVDREQHNAIDQLVEEGIYPNRSDAVRELVSIGLDTHEGDL